MSIGLRIKELRTKEKLSQDEFSASIGIKRANLGQIELGNQLPTIKILSFIVKKYHTTYTYLIDGEFNEAKEGSAVSDVSASYSTSCPRCRDKERIIDLLEEKIEIQQQKINSMSKSPEDKNSNYSQTA